ncbi:thioredoxin family protein [Thomasclavelia sp.]|uniref:thioredoxin family protein n=1 Tax=Thomasclavelia sp. TaxID=3025757 RepID=UPI0025CE998E|nr:thioredoxin family protein [Thomasclavelia sp.]
MRFFNKKNESCCGNFNQETIVKNNEKGIKILGTGCKKCNALHTAVKEAVDELQLDIKIEHINDFSQIAMYGIISTPALVIDEQVVSFGKVLNKDEVIKILQTRRK